MVGLTTSPDRLIQIRRNRLLSLNQTAETAYVDQEAVARELAFARRTFADRGWPTIDVTRRSIEETAAAIINLLTEAAAGDRSVTLLLASRSAARQAMLAAGGVAFAAEDAGVDEESATAALRAEGVSVRNTADALAELKAVKLSRRYPRALVLGCDTTVATAGGEAVEKATTREEQRATLRALAGTTHVLTSAVVAAQEGAPIWRHVDGARLTMRAFSDDFLDAYLDEEWPAIGACVGGYRLEGRGIQLFARIEGDHHTILGLPLLALLGWLRERGVVAR